MDLKGRHAVVTGAANGIGRALAERFHGAGARVVVADLDGDGAVAVAAALDASRPGSALGLDADVGTEDGNRSLIGRAPMSPESEWKLAFDVNVHAHRWAVKYLLPEWLARGAGYFCSTASAAGLLSQIGSAPYSLTKHAAVAFAEWMSVTYGDRGLRVSCLCPMGVRTAMLNAGLDMAGDEGLGTRVVAATGDVLEPEEVAGVVVEAIGEERFLV